MTTKNDIGRWFDKGVSDGWKFMAVMCDTFDYSDYPKYFDSKVDLIEIQKDPGSMQKVMETYDLTADMWDQLAKPRNFV
jgi:hypothetical protein